MQVGSAQLLQRAFEKQFGSCRISSCGAWLK